MDKSFKESLWFQFGASIDMLENALVMCPDDHWDTDKKFWYIGYHTLFFLDYYLSEDPKNFAPPAPFSMSASDPSEPTRVHTKEELLPYLRSCRQKCHDLIAGLTEERAAWRFINERKNYSTLEILLYNMRHVQHHAAQLNLLLRQGINNAPSWVSRTGVN